MTTIRVTLEKTTDDPADALSELLEHADGWRLVSQEVRDGSVQVSTGDQVVRQVVQVANVSGGSAVQIAGRSIIRG